VIIVIVKFVPSYKYFLDCIPEQEERVILNFLDWISKHSQD